MAVNPSRQSAACMMQEAGSLVGGLHHLEIANIENIDMRQVHATVLLRLSQELLALLFGQTTAGEQLPQHRVGTSRIHFRESIDQELWLRAVMRRICVHPEKLQQAVNQVVNRGSKIRGAHAFAAPAIET